MNLEKEVTEFLKNIGESEEERAEDFGCTVNIAHSIMVYAHQYQKRDNDFPYMIHPFNCKIKYQRFVGIVDRDPFCIDVDLMNKYNIPFSGVQEVCLLHDVIEDTNVTLEEIKEVFVNNGYKTYFELYMEQPLQFITHDKSMDYEEYIKIVNKNRISAMVKFMDLIDNLNLLDLSKLTKLEVDRATRYVKYAKMINDEYHFLENIMKYRDDYYEENKKYSQNYNDEKI